jgi:hypothetical protein
MEKDGSVLFGAVFFCMEVFWLGLVGESSFKAKPWEKVQQRKLARV